MPAFRNGQEVFPVTINTICPIAHADQARELCVAHMEQMEEAKGVTLQNVLGINLGPIGVDEVTHIFCSRPGYTYQVDLALESFSKESLPWGGSRAYSFLSDPSEIKNLFCIVLGDTEKLLKWLGLEVKP